jgi:hypothetical protein
LVLVLVFIGAREEKEKMKQQRNNGHNNIKYTVDRDPSPLSALRLSLFHFIKNVGFGGARVRHISHIQSGCCLCN